MESRRLRGFGGWLAVYVIGSVPLVAAYSVGLSGWFFEYPVGLMVAIFLVLAVPLMLVLVRSPKAPLWNIAQVWIVAVLIALRSISVFLEPGRGELMRSQELLSVVLTLSGIVSVAVVWAAIWTRYFKVSLRVRNTFTD